MASPTFTDYFNLGKAEAINRQPELTFDQGDISEFYMISGAAMADHLTGYTAQRFKILYLDGASGDDLTVLASDRYGIERNAATAAFGTVTLSRASAALGAGVVLAGTVISTVTDAQGTTVQVSIDNDTSFGISTLSVTGVAVTAINTGTEGNVSANTLVNFNTSVFDLILTVTNPSRMAGGQEAESDESLRERVRNFQITIRRGTIASLEYGAQTVGGVGRAIAQQDNTGLVNVYVSDTSGNSNPTMVADVTAELVNWTAAGASVSVVGASIFSQAVTLAIAVRPGVDSLALTAQIKAAVVARINQLRIGETLFKYAIQQAVLNVDQNIISVTISVPSGDVVPSADQLIQTSTSIVTVS